MTVMDNNSLRIFAILCSLASSTLFADSAMPAWYSEGVGLPDWHYRAPLVLPASGAINSTIQLDVDFNLLLTQLGVDSGTDVVDSNSIRIVRGNGILAATQEYTDQVYSGVLDAVDNNRGEIRFLLQDTPASGIYYLYFDITANGAKPVSPALTLNGNFEHSSGSSPDEWVTSAVNTGGAQNNEVYQTSVSNTINLGAGCSSSAASNVDNSPYNSGGVASGQAWHLIGYRDNCEDGSGNERIQLTKSIAVPSGTAAGSLEFFFQVQGWDGIQNNNNYDWFAVFVNDTAVNHRNLGIDNSTSPQLRIDRSRMGRQVYSTTFRDHGWKQATLDLSSYQGSTINLRLESRHSASDNAYRSWIKIDDISWSVQTASIGIAEGFGINIIAPNDTAVSAPGTYTATQNLLVRVLVDAVPQNITADVYDDLGTQVASGIPLFDDGSHGDVTTGDRIYTNDGSVFSEATYTVQGTDPGGSNWLVRVIAPDGSTSGIGADNGLLHRSGQANTPSVQPNFFNIDEQLFTVQLARLEIQKTVNTINDPLNGTSLPKAIPGAVVRNELLVINLGPDGSDNNSITINEVLPANVSMCVTSTCSGTADPVSFDDTTSPEPSGLFFDYGNDVLYSTDGVTFNSSTSPDLDGYDNQITHLRVKPSGAFSAPGPGGNPSFLIRYVVRLD